MLVRSGRSVGRRETRGKPEFIGPHGALRRAQSRRRVAKALPCRYKYRRGRPLDPAAYRRAGAVAIVGVRADCRSPTRERHVPRCVILLGFAFLVGPGPVTGWAQPPAAPAAETIPDHVRQLQTCREGILDPQIRPDDRRRWADLLLSYDSTQANALVVELLSLSSRPDVQGALCTALGVRSRGTPDRLDASFVDPLLTLLGAETEELRAAAAQALAEFPGTGVPQRLGALASRADAPMPKRLAAIDAMAPNTHRREVVEQLIELLGLDVPEITDRVAAALEPIAPRSFGGGVQDWRSWWKDESELGEEAWLAEQLRIYRDRARRLGGELHGVRSDAERDQAAVTARVREFQRELFRPLNSELRDAKLVEWIDDPLPVVKLAALGIVKSRIADEGKRPEGDVPAALLRLLKHDSAAVRREALQILQNLSDPSVVEGVLARVGEEKDATTRQALFQALGKLGTPAAVPALVREIASTASSPDCVREAALALSQIAAKPESKDSLREATSTLAERSRSLPADPPALRAALLTAMAGIGDPSFTPDFVAAVEADDAVILPAALRGLKAVGDSSKLPRIRTLMAHADPRVRLAAIEAAGQLGREDADVEALLSRLNPAVESNDSAREAAWRGFRQLVGKRAIPDRIRAAERLREMPDLSVKYLDELAGILATSGDHAAELDAVRDRLATTLVAAGKDGEAVPHLRALYEMRLTRADGAAQATGLRWLESVLRSPNPQGAAEVVVRLGEATGAEPVKVEIIRTVAQYLEIPAAVADADRSRKLLAELRTVPSDLLGDPWTQLLQRFAAQLEPKERPAAPPSSP